MKRAPGRTRGRPPYPGPITPAEQRVLDGLKRGLTYQGIADELGVTYDAVKYHVSNMLSKAGVESREQLVEWASARRPLSGLLSLGLIGRIGAAVGVLVAAGGVIAVLATMGDDDETAEDVLDAASETMARESFRMVDDDCPLCPPPTVMEFAPPDRVKLSGGKGHDSWPYALLIGDEAYLSNDGQRWQTGGALEFLGMALGDPRVLVTVLKSAELEADEDIDGRRAAAVVGELDYDAFFDRLHQSFHDPGARDSLRTLLEGTRFRIWIDREDERVVQVEATYPDPEEEPAVARFEYGPVDVPGEVESIDTEEAQRLGVEVERTAGPLLLAVEEYRARTGAYPAELDPTTLAGIVAAGQWPENQFSGGPVKRSPDNPGDFDYLLIEGGTQFQFTLHGWDAAIMYYDSARWGPVPPEAVRYR